MSLVRLTAESAPATPPAGYVYLYLDTSDSVWKYKNDAGVVNRVGQYTDEMAQDAIGTILVDTATIDLTYSDATPSITASVIDGSITNAKVSASAAIALNKLAAVTASRALVSDGSGFISSHANTTSTEVGYLNGVTSAIQTQINGKEPTITVLTVAKGGTGTSTAFTAGSVVFAGASGIYTQDNANFFYDAGNFRLGIGTSSPSTTLHVVGTLTCSAIDTGNGAKELNSGTYTPTLTAVTNITASTAYVCQWIQLGSTVTVSGRVDIDTTASGGSQLGVSLPVASNFAAEQECAGTICAYNIANNNGAVYADATNDRAEIRFLSNSTSNNSFAFIFQYRVI